MTSTFTFRDAKLSDIEGIVRLRKSVEGGNDYFDRSEHYYQWKYFQNPNGKSIVKIALTQDGEIVGLVSASPKRFYANGHEILALEWGDFFTHEKHQRKGIFSQLCRDLLEEIKELNFTFSYIRPNNNSYPIVTTKLGFQDIDKLEERFYLIAINKLLSNRFNKFVKPFAYVLLSTFIRLVQKPPDSSVNDDVRTLDKNTFQALYLKQKESSNFFMVKDKGYLNWRFFETPIPMRFYALVQNDMITDYMVVAQDRKDGVYIVEFHSINNQNGKKLINRMLTEAIEEKRKRVSVCVRASNQTDDLLCHIIREYGFRKISAPLHLVYLEHKEKIDIPSWQFRLADIDGV